MFFEMVSCFCCSILFSPFSSGLTKTGSKHEDFLKQRRKLFWNAKKKHAESIENFTLFWETRHLSKNNVKPSQPSDSFYTRSLSKGCSFLPSLSPQRLFPFSSFPSSFSFWCQTNLGIRSEVATVPPRVERRTEGKSVYNLSFFPGGGRKRGVACVYPEEYCVWCVYRRWNGEMLWLPSLTPLGEERNSLWFVCFIVSGLGVGVGPYRWICTHNVYAHI